MSKKQIVGLIFIIIGLGGVLFCTFKHFEQEEEKILETAIENKKIEEQDRKEKEAQELEEKRKKEEGQQEVSDLVEKLKNTKKIILANYDETGELKSIDTLHTYTEIKTITEESTIEKIRNYFAESVWQEFTNDNLVEKIWQFYDSEDKLILEYVGHALVTSNKKVTIYLPEEVLKSLNEYFEEE